MRAVDFTAEQQTAPALLPMRRERREMQHHERAAGFAVSCCAAEGGLEEVSQLRRSVSMVSKVRKFG
jgi:hypothetical protein